MTGRVILSKSVYASVAHRYWNAQWSEAENRNIYGSDASSEGLGHNLRLELSVDAEHEADLLPKLNALKAKVDHLSLFAPESELYATPSTLENITLWLSRAIPGEWISLTVWETEHLACSLDRGIPGVRMIVKRNNLQLEIERIVDPVTGLALKRGEVTAVLQQELVKLNENNDSDLSRWSGNLYSRIAHSLPGLCALRIDLQSHESLVVHS